MAFRKSKSVVLCKKMSMCNNTAEEDVLLLLKTINMPGVRLCESESDICTILKEKGYKYTPDIICGPPDINEAPLEGLFFIDVNEPSGDFLFKKKVSEQLNKNVSQAFYSFLYQDKEYSRSFSKLPTEHHQNYLKVLNDKLEKYSHCRNQSANTAIVHHFNLGNIEENSFEKPDKFLAMLDYIRFYFGIENKSDNKDLLEAEKYLLKNILGKETQTPYLISVRRDMPDVPVLFLMLHIAASKNGKRYDAGIILLNGNILERYDRNHPIFKWMFNFLKSSQSVSTNETQEFNIQFNVTRGTLPFI